MPLLNTPNSENQAINTPLSEQKPAKFEKSRHAVRGTECVLEDIVIGRCMQRQ